MDNKKKISMEEFLYEIQSKIDPYNGIATREIYQLFPELNEKTVSWRLYDLIQRKKIHRNSHGNYTLMPQSFNASMGYEYLSNVSKKVYNESLNYGYDFYLSGLDALAGELLHIPENFPTIVVVDKNDMDKFAENLSNLGLIITTEKKKKFLDESELNIKLDVIILQGKGSNLSIDNIAIKEKAFVDLYYAVTRLDYPVSIQELIRTFDNLKRNKSITDLKMKLSGKERGISTEIDWIMQIEKMPLKSKKYMYYELKEIL